MSRSNTQSGRAIAVAISSLLTAICALGNYAHAGELRVSRYQTVLLKPIGEHVELLTSIVDPELPEQIHTIGQAITHLLDGSGYHLLSAELAAPYRARVLALPVPESLRHLGPISLRDALARLSGPALRLVIQPGYRLISFEAVSTETNGETDAAP